MKSSLKIPFLVKNIYNSNQYYTQPMQIEFALGRNLTEKVYKSKQ